jgi:hypothetical protein
MTLFLRYPVILRRFCLRKQSGGRGKWTGGDGVYRDIQFRRPLQLSILTERRVFEPYGKRYPWTLKLTLFKEWKAVNPENEARTFFIAAETIVVSIWALKTAFKLRLGYENDLRVKY